MIVPLCSSPQSVPHSNPRCAASPPCSSSLAGIRTTRPQTSLWLRRMAPRVSSGCSGRAPGCSSSRASLASAALVRVTSPAPCLAFPAVRVMAGESLGVSGVIKMRNPGLLLDVRLSPGAALEQHVPQDWNGFAVSPAESAAGRRCRSCTTALRRCVRVADQWLAHEMPPAPPACLLSPQYVYEGAGRIGGQAAQVQTAYVLADEGNTVGGWVGG